MTRAGCQRTRSPRDRERSLVVVWLMLTIAAVAVISVTAGATQVGSAVRCAPVADVRLRSAQPVAKPGYLESVLDPAFGSRITRITGDPGTALPGGGGSWGAIATHNHAKDAVWNTDQSLMVLKNVRGARGYVFLDGSSYQPLWVASDPGGETRWHPVRPDLMTYVRSDCAVGHWNVRTNTTTTVVAPAGYTRCGLGPWEGNLSADGRWLALSAVRRRDQRLVAFVIDVTTRAKHPDLDLVASGVTELDWVSVSATGTYVVVNGTIAGCTTVDKACDATRVFSRSGAQVGPSWSEYGRPSHYDLTVGADGADVAVGVAKSGPDEGKVIMRRLRDGAITVLSPGGYSQHHSARNLRRPGWAYASHPYNGPHWPPFRNEVYAVKLDGSLAVERIAQLFATTPTYESEPQAVPSPDGARVVFASNWGADQGPVQTYIADTRPPCHGSSGLTHSADGAATQKGRTPY